MHCRTASIGFTPLFPVFINLKPDYTHDSGTCTEKEIGEHDRPEPEKFPECRYK